MKLGDLVTQYVAFRKSLGERCSNEHVLRFFCRKLGSNRDVRTIRVASVCRFLAGSGPITRTWHRKYTALRTFYRYALTRGHVTSVPLPITIPKEPPGLTPYIYSREELRRLLDATALNDGLRYEIEPLTLRTILLVLYGAGLRAGEVLRLNLPDVDLTTAVLTVRLSKFFKSRLVPVGPQLAQALIAYSMWRQSAHPPVASDSPFFVGRAGKRLSYNTLEGTFRRLRAQAGIRRADGGRYQPRLHDLRHTFAVHRLVAWYRQGANVQQLLPYLSVYLGHIYLVATQVYLTMTPELLQEASARFERYVGRDAFDE